MATLGRSNEGSTEPRISFPEQSEGAVLAELTSLELYQHAAQPDVVLSQQRDVYYSNSLLGESISELMETFLGSRRTTILAPELKALASCLYFGLTNLAGKQTLGQEYCNIGLVRSGRSGRARKHGTQSGLVSGVAAWLYTLARVSVPYLQERMQEGCHGLSQLGRNPAANVMAGDAIARARARVSPVTGVVDRPELAGTVSSDLVRRTSTPRQRRACAPSAILRNLQVFLAWARRKRPAIAGVLDWLLRLHLALFYFDGRYANLAMRVVGARLRYVRETEAPGARYGILGVFLLVQLVGEVAAAAGTLMRAGTSGSQSNRLAGQESGNDSDDWGQASSRVPSISPERTTVDAVLFPRSRRRCSLCMSPRENAAATPCGHLFCWECIVGWCQVNPECPLCRQPVAPQSIVCVYQYV